MLNSKRVHRAVYAFAFLIPAAVFLCVYAGMGMAPWGDKTILATDMSDQYVEFFCGLKYGDLFFSWSKALGSSYTGVISYYVSSPLSLLTLLVPNAYMPIGLLFLTALKIGLAGLTFSIYSLRRFPQAGAASLLCAVCYALMSYNAAYSVCIMWLDGVIWLPIILLGIERMLEGRGKILLTASLAVCFLSTWYISYMIGIFCCLYLAFRLISRKTAWAEAVRRAGTMLGCAVLALCLTAWLWLPTFLAMFTGKFSGASMDYAGLLNFPLGSLFGQFIPGQYHSLTNTALPFVYCGMVILLLFAAYFFCRSIPLREKLACAGVVLVLLASLWLSPLDKVWHLFKMPNWFPFRYAFVFSFFLIMTANRTLPFVLDALKRLVRPAAAWGVLAAVLALTIVDLSWNTKSILTGVDRQFGYESNQEYVKYYRTNVALTAAAKEDSGSSFVRMGAVEDRGHNSPLTFGYAGITHYSSLYNNDVNVLLRKLGFAQTWMWCAYYGSTPVTDALFGIQYIFSEQDMPGYQEMARSGALALWKAPAVVPLAFLTPAASGLTLKQDGTVFDTQNALLSDLTGQDAEVLTPIPVDSIQQGGGEVVLTFRGTGAPVYADLYPSGFQSVTVDGELVVTLGTSEAASVHCLGAPASGAACTVTVRCQDGLAVDWNRFFWQADLNSLDAAVQTLDNTQVLTVNNSTVTVEAQTDRAQLLATTIPAEAGWTAYVDGRRVETQIFLDTFLAVPLEAGSHTITFRYFAPGLGAGLGLGAAAVLFLAAAWWWKRRAGQRAQA